MNKDYQMGDLSFSMNLTKSLLGGFGMRCSQEASESSSDPKPL